MRNHPLLVSILAALAACSEEERFDARGCIGVTPEQMVCPSGRDVSPRDLFLPGRCGDDLEIVEVKSEGALTMITGQDGMTSSAGFDVHQAVGL